MALSHRERKRVRAVLAGLGKNGVCVLLMTGAVLVLLHGIFVAGFPVYRDNPAHVAKAYAYVESLRQGGSLLGGWSTRNCAGYPLLLYYPKTGFWLIAAFHFVLSLSVVLAYKIVMLLSVLLPLMGVFFLLRKDSSRLAALFCSLLFLVQNNLIHYALSGMWSNALATGVLFLFGAALFAFSDNPTHRNAIGAGLLLGLLTVTHLYVMLGGVMLWVAVFVLSLAFSEGKRRLRSLLLLLVPAIGVLTSYFYTHQVVKASGWLMPGKGELRLLSFGTVVGNLFWKGDFFRHGGGVGAAANVIGNIGIVVGILFAVLGIAYAFDGSRKERGFYVRAVSVLVLMVLSSAVASGIMAPGVGLKGEWLGNLAFLRSTKIQGYRFMVVARVGMVYFCGYGLSRLMRDRSLPAIAGIGKARLVRRFRWPVVVPVCGSVFLAANLPFFFYERSLEEIRRNPFFPARDKALLKTSSTLPTMKDLAGVCEWLRRRGDDRERRVFFQDTLGNARLKWIDISRGGDEGTSLNVRASEDTITHFTHLPAICPILSGMPQVGSWIGGSLFPIEKISMSESGMFFGWRVEDFDDNELVTEKRFLQRLNIRYVVTCEGRLRSRLMSSRYFTHRESFGGFDIFELPDVLYTMHEPGWAYFSLPARYIPNNRVEVRRFDEGEIEISFENYATMVDLHVAACDHPFWKASVDGKPIRMESDEIGLMKIPLEVKDEKGRARSLLGSHSVTIRYVPEGGGSVAVSLVSLVLSVILLFIPRQEAKGKQSQEESVIHGGGPE